jgi:hypothetical protein
MVGTKRNSDCHTALDACNRGFSDSGIRVKEAFVVSDAELHKVKFCCF